MVICLERTAIGGGLHSVSPPRGDTLFYPVHMHCRWRVVWSTLRATTSDADVNASCFTVLSTSDIV